MMKKFIANLIVGLIAVAIFGCLTMEANAFPRPLKRLKQTVCHRHNGQASNGACSNGACACQK
jgi:hypothetical protein